MKILFLAIFLSTFFIVGTSLSAPNTGGSGGDGGGAGGVGASSPTQVLYNKAGVKTGDTGLIYDDANNILTVGSVVTDDIPGSNVIILNDNDSGITCNIGGGTKDIGLYTDSLNGTEDSLMICNDAGVAKEVAFVGRPGTRVLLAQLVGFSQVTEVELNAVDWEDTYDTVELEFIGVFPTIAGSGMRIKSLNGASTPFAGGMSYSAVTSNSNISVTDPWRLDVASIAWRTDSTVGILDNASSGITGTARITAQASGELAGVASWMYHEDQNNSMVLQHIGLRQTGIPTTGHYGFVVDAMPNNTTTITGTLKLWGIVK